MSGEAARVLENYVQRLRQLIGSYNSSRPSSLGLELEGPFDIDELSTTEITRRPGAYLIFCEDGRFKYTGMSAKGTIRGRIREHLKPKTQASSFWRNCPPKFFCVIATPGEEAGALEEYLQNNGFYGSP